MTKRLSIFYLTLGVLTVAAAPLFADGRGHKSKLVVTPSSLNFSAQLVPGEPTPAPEAKTLEVRGIKHSHSCKKHKKHHECDSLFWTAKPNQAWINMEPDSGFTPDRAMVTVDPAGLPEGEHRGEIRFDTPSQRKSKIVKIKLRIRSPEPHLVLQPDHIDFISTAFSNRILAESVRVSVVGTDDVEFETSHKQSWLKVIPDQGETPELVTILAFTDSLAPGFYHDTVVFKGEEDDGDNGHDGDGDDDEKLVALLPVTLTLRPDGGERELRVTPRQLGFAANFGGPNPNPQGVLISATAGSIPWSAAVSQSWLAVNPASGTATSSPSVVDVAVDIDALNPGLYQDTITFTSSQSGVAAVKVAVFLQIFPPSGLSDSVDIIDQTIDLTGQPTRFSVPIFASNTQALLGIILPLVYTDGQAQLDSASFAGSRVEFADVKLFLPLQTPNHFLVFIGFIGTPPLPPGQGLIGRLHFTAAGAPPGGRDTLIIDSASVPNQSAMAMGETALPAALSISYIVTTGANQFIMNPAFSKGTVVLRVPTSADEFGGNIPREFSLGQNYPNPFNPHTAISFALPQAAEVRLDVFDMLGRWVITLMKGQEPAGRHHVIWDGRDKSGRMVSSGMYLYRLKAGNFEETKKMMFLK